MALEVEKLGNLFFFGGLLMIDLEEIRFGGFL